VYVKDVDGVVEMAEIVRVRIDEAKPYDLYGTAIGASSSECCSAKSAEQALAGTSAK